MTDFGPLLSNPKSMLMGAAAQLGVFCGVFPGHLHRLYRPGSGFHRHHRWSRRPHRHLPDDAAGPHLLGPIAIAAYSYMALIPLIQPPFMKLLTTGKERRVVMKQAREVSKTEKIIFPIVVTVFVSILLPPQLR